MRPSARSRSLSTSKIAVGLLAIAFIGCPLPQPLPEVVSVNGGALPPPRIVVSSIKPSDTIVPVDQTCASPEFSLEASIIDENTEELVEARWFVDYDSAASPNRDPVLVSSLPAPASESTIRTVPAYRFAPYNETPWTFHLVELVISNGFYPLGAEPSDALPNRAAQPGFETQVYRWAFESVPSHGRCQ